MLAFKLDENLSESVARFFRESGYDAKTVHQQGLAGATDDSVATICQSERRIIITCDTDFAHFVNELPQRCGAAVVLRLDDQRLDALERAAKRIVATLEQQPIEGRIWIVESRRIRIRRLND